MTALALSILFLLASAGLVLAALAWYTAGVARRIASGLAPNGRFVDIDGVRLHVRDEGSGPPLLLVHGLNGQMRHFDFGEMAHLARHFRVIAVDRPGAGHSARPADGRADLPAQARLLAQLIAHLGLERPVVVGHSLGAAVALALALDHPRAVGALALVAPLSHPGQPVPQVFKALTLRPRLLVKLVAWTLATPVAVTQGRKLLADVFAPDPVPNDFMQHGGGLLSLRPSQFIAAAADLKALAADLPRQARRYPELQVPLAVLAGRDDRLLDWRANAEQLVEQVPGARLELVAGGHMLPVTHPALTARFVMDAASARRLAA